MDALAGQSLDHLLAEPAQRDAVPGELRMILDHADQVAPRRIGVEAEQQVGRRQMEEAQRVGLDDLPAMHDFAQLRRRWRDAHAHDGFARLGRGEQMADRADAADARGDRRHLIERPSLAELFEPAKLGDVERRCPVTWPSSSRWMVIFAWPSMRVTGSMTMVFMMLSSAETQPGPADRGCGPPEAR